MMCYQIRCCRCSRILLQPLYNKQFSILCRNKSSKTHYEVLGLPHTASHDQIKAAFIDISKKVHPDQNKNDSCSHEKFVEVNEAYTVLSKKLSRRDYDMKLKYEEHPVFKRTKFDETDYPNGWQDYNDPSQEPYWKSDPFSDHGYEYYQRQRKLYPSLDHCKCLPYSCTSVKQTLFWSDAQFSFLRFHIRQHNKRVREAEWKENAAEWRQNASKWFRFFGVTDNNPFSGWLLLPVALFLSAFIYLMYDTYTNHPEKFKNKFERDRELEILLLKNSRERERLRDLIVEKIDFLSSESNENVSGTESGRFHHGGLLLNVSDQQSSSRKASSYHGEEELEKGFLEKARKRDMKEKLKEVAIED